jgi:hypothetical protein
VKEEHSTANANSANVILPYSVVSGHFWQKPASVQGPPEFVEAGEEREKLKIENPTFIATEEMLWLRADGTEILIQAAVGIPYKDRGPGRARWR